MKRTAFLIATLLLAATTANAGPNWQTISFSTSPADAPKVVAAMEKLMSAQAANLTGSVSLMANVAGGSTSHTVISSFDSRAARETWTGQLQTSPAWATFTKTTSTLIQPGETSRLDFVKEWGTESDKDVFWEIFAFTVSDAGAFSASIDTLMASVTGKKFPGSVYLSRVAAAGMSPVTHLVSVGYENEAEAEAWNATMAPSADWATYQKASRKVATINGGFFIRTIKTWGNTSDTAE